MEQARATLKYSKEHEWVQVEGRIATVGITPYAQDCLGDMVFIDLPSVGDKLTVGDSFAVAESVKAASEIYAPVSGTVVAVNHELADAPEVLNTAPFDDGWIIKIDMSNPNELDDLMGATDYTTYIEGLV